MTVPKVPNSHLSICQEPDSRLSWTALSGSHAPATCFPQPGEERQRWVSRSGKHDPWRHGCVQMRI